ALAASSSPSRLRWASARGLRLPRSASTPPGAFAAPARRKRLVTSALKFRVSSCQTEGPSVYRPEASSVYSCFAPLAILRCRSEDDLRFLNLETIMSKSFGAASTTNEVLEGVNLNGKRVLV